MRRILKPDLQVSCQRKRWTIGIGNHRNILVFYSRYPLEGALDLGDLSNGDFAVLSDFFKAREKNSKATTAHAKWTFAFDQHCNLLLSFVHFPFSGLIELGEVSKETCVQLSNLFTVAQRV
jgi:hypothetical protein